MNKPLSLILLFNVLVLATTNPTFSQDTSKKAQRAAAPAKPAVAPGTYGYKPTYVKPAQPAVVDNSLPGQYNAIIKSTYRYQQDPINTFYKSVMDSINTQKRKLKDAQNKLATQAKTIADLQGDVSTKEQTLSESQSKVNSVSFFGIPMSKGSYNVIMWGMVLVLGGSLVAVIFLSASSRREAAYRIQLHDELAAEFQAYKTKANDKEKKLARELQTERNKLDDLMGR